MADGGSSGSLRDGVRQDGVYRRASRLSGATRIGPKERRRNADILGAHYRCTLDVHRRQERLGRVPDARRRREDANYRVHSHGGISSHGRSRALGAAGTAGTGEHVTRRLPAEVRLVRRQAVSESRTLRFAHAAVSPLPPPASRLESDLKIRFGSQACSVQYLRTGLGPDSHLFFASPARLEFPRNLTPRGSAKWVSAYCGSPKTDPRDSASYRNRGFLLCAPPLPTSCSAAAAEKLRSAP